MQRTIRDVFEMQKANGKEAFNISVSFIEIYTDQVYDLLSNDEKRVNVKGERTLPYIIATTSGIYCYNLF